MIIDTNNRKGIVNHPAHGTRTIHFVGSKEIDAINASLAIIGCQYDSPILSKEK